MTTGATEPKATVAALKEWSRIAGAALACLVICLLAAGFFWWVGSLESVAWALSLFLGTFAVIAGGGLGFAVVLLAMLGGMDWLERLDDRERRKL